MGGEVGWISLLRPPGHRPLLDRDPLTETPGRDWSLSGASVQGPQTEIPQHRPPWTETPSWKGHGTKDRDPLGRKRDQTVRQEVTSNREPPVNRITGTHF